MASTVGSEMPGHGTKPWDDDHLLREAAREYVDRYGRRGALEHLREEYAIAAGHDDTFYCETLAHIAAAVHMLALITQIAATRKRSAKLVNEARVLCEIAAQTQAESRFLRASLGSASG